MSATSIPTKQMAVYQALRGEIMSGRLKPGQTLVIDQLAKRFQVSIIPVREALRQLQSEHLIEIKPHTGVRVTPVDISALVEIFALLAALESASALQALPRMEQTDWKQFQAIMTRLEDTAARGDSTGFEAANRDFHLLPCRIAGFSRAEQTLNALLAEWERLHRLAFRGTQPPDPLQANKEHRGILRALRQGDEGKLRAAINKHNASACAYYQGLIA